jgi:RNA polymerase sigma-70 factor (ECF subfamily)
VSKQEVLELNRPGSGSHQGSQGPEDGDLLARTAAGDRLAFRLLHQRYEAYAFWLARRVLASAADAEDVVQEAWVKVFSRANADVPSERVRAWLRTVVVRCCLDHHRRLTRVPDAAELAPDLAGPGHVPGLRLDLEKALAALPGELRRVVVLHDIEGLAHGEVAGLLHITAEASRSRLSRARRLLRRSLGPA